MKTHTEANLMRPVINETYSCHIHILYKSMQVHISLCKMIPLIRITKLYIEPDFRTLSAQPSNEVWCIHINWISYWWHLPMGSSGETWQMIYYYAQRNMATIRILSPFPKNQKVTGQFIIEFYRTSTYIDGSNAPCSPFPTTIRQYDLLNCQNTKSKVAWLLSVENQKATSQAFVSPQGSQTLKQTVS